MAMPGPCHPGETLRDDLATEGLTVTETMSAPRLSVWRVRCRHCDTNDRETGEIPASDGRSVIPGSSGGTGSPARAPVGLATDEKSNAT